MSTALGRLVRQVRRRVDPSADLGDSSLLAHWVEQADQSAFELLLWRHGPMVWDTCRHVLRHEQDAEDAFQAAFLALARKASSIRRSPSLAGWLYRVAHRAALSARSRPRPVEVIADLDAVAFARPGAPGELNQILDEEIGRLPERYREAFVLCHLEGMTTDEAAAVLGCPRGTVGTRVAWAREKLRQRLRSRGVDLPARMPTCLVPPPLIESVLASVSGGPIAPAVADLCQGVITMLFSSRVKSLIVYLLPLVFALVGVGGLCLTAGQEQSTKKEVKKPVEQDKPKPAKPEAAPGVQGVVKEVSKDGKTVTVVTQKKNKTDDEKTVELKLTDKTKVLFSGVGVGEAVAKPGYSVSALLVKGSEDTAESVTFMGEKNAKGQKPSLQAPISAVADDGKSITLLIKAKKKHDDAVEQTVVLTGKTAQVFEYVGPNEAKLAKDLTASVWLEDGSKDKAAQVVVRGTAEIPSKKTGGGAADVFGTVTALAKDGKSFTLTTAKKKKGEDGEKVELKLADASKNVFAGIGPGKARIEVGQQAMVWLDGSSKDTVATALFRPGTTVKSGDLSGKVTAVADDGKSFTIQLPPEKKNEDGKSVEIKLAQKAQVIFNGVPPGGAKIAKEQFATVQLAEGSKDSAAKAVFSVAKGK